MNACLALACWAAAALAEPGAAAASSRLTVRIAAAPVVVTDFTDRLGPRLTARGVMLEVTSVPEVDLARLVATPADSAADAPLARVWLDGRDPDRALLFLKPRQGDRVLVRKIELAAGFDRVALSQIAYIIETAVASLLVSEPIGVPQSEAQAAVEALLPTAPPAVEPPPPGPLYRLGAFGGVGTWSSEAAVVARVGLEGALEQSGGTRRLGLMASVVGDPGFHVSSDVGQVLARSLALHLYVTGTWRAERYGSGKIGVGPALVITRVEPALMGSSSVTVTQTPLTDYDPAVGMTVRWELPLGRRTSVFLAALFDVVLVRPRYAATVRGRDEVLFSPWMIRPGLVLGVATGSELR